MTVMPTSPSAVDTTSTALLSELGQETSISSSGARVNASDHGSMTTLICDFDWILYVKLTISPSGYCELNDPGKRQFFNS